MVKIPINSSVKVNNNWLNAEVDNLYIIVPENTPPFLMIFEKEDKLSCFISKGDMDLLSKAMDFN